MYLLQEDTPPLVILHCSPSAIHSGLCKVMLNCCMNSELSGGEERGVRQASIWMQTSKKCIRSTYESSLKATSKNASF